MEVSRSEDDVGRSCKGERTLLAEAVAEELWPVHDEDALGEAQVCAVPEVACTKFLEEGICRQGAGAGVP